MTLLQVLGLYVFPDLSNICRNILHKFIGGPVWSCHVGVPPRPRDLNMAAGR